MTTRSPLVWARFIEAPEPIFTTSVTECPVLSERSGLEKRKDQWPVVLSSKYFPNRNVKYRQPIDVETTSLFARSQSHRDHASGMAARDSCA
jgi:hypothetical protein